MGIPPRITSTASTSTQENNTQQIKITRKKQLFLLFWVAERDPARDFFKESAQTRLINIKTFKDFDIDIHKIHCPPLHGFTEIQSIIDNWITHYGGENKVEIKEISFFSHAGLDGPIIYTAKKNTPIEMLEKNYLSQLKMEYWGKINFYWAKEARLNFLGCNTAYYESEDQRFIKTLSKSINTKNIVISGQPTSSFPSFYPDRRFTSIARSLTYKKINFSPEFTWDVGPTYMVAGNAGEGEKSLKRDEIVKVNKLFFYKNDLLLLESHQSIFNDHRVNRKKYDNSEEYVQLNRWITYGFNK